jgi:hypothetical protein
MRRFLTSHDFGVFRYHSVRIRDAYNSVIEEVGA